MTNMKRWLAALVCGALIFTSTICSATTMSVQVKSSPLRSGPSFLAKMTGEVHYGDRLEVLETKNSWAKVNAAGLEGWLHNSVLSEKKIALTAGESDVASSADAGEVALAGKGFNAEVEEEFRKDSELNYQAVDLIQTYGINDREKIAFIRAGGLSGAEVLK
jgi:SH3-like domain-containing protein